MKKQIGRMVMVWAFAWSGVQVSACSSPDNSGDGGPSTTNPSADPCGAQFDAMEKGCPTGNERDVSVEICKSDERMYAGIGCQDEFDAWLQRMHLADGAGRLLPAAQQQAAMAQLRQIGMQR